MSACKVSLSISFVLIPFSFLQNQILELLSLSTNVYNSLNVFDLSRNSFIFIYFGLNPSRNTKLNPFLIDMSFNNGRDGLYL